MQAAFSRRYFSGWLVVAVTVVATLLIFGIRSAPSVLIKPLEADFGWPRGEVSSAIAIGLLFTGLSAPFGGAFLSAGALAVLGALMALRIDRTPLPEAPLAPAGASV